ncbi:MAG: hypothetical protein Q9180_008729, partial [Flavoplaca navasiana]
MKQCRGSFARRKTLLNATNPGLCVHGLGAISLPLPERDAVELRKACHRTSFGKGTETLVDTKVRDVWELDANQFTLQNRVCQATLDHVLGHVVKALGISGGSLAVRAELYKLPLYDKAAFFDSNTDTEKVPGIISTVVIALPSEHIVGDVQTRFEGKYLTLSTAESSKFGYSYIIWYSDVEHAVRPLYRRTHS